MSICQNDWILEQDRLEMVIEHIRNQLNEKLNSAQNARRDLMETQKSMWDHVNPTPSDLDDLANIWQYQVDIEREGRRYKVSELEIKRLEKLLKNPYFGRIDFCDDGEDSIEAIYIGISTLKDKKTDNLLIYDWRAPVSSMFYDYENGRAAYKCPAGIIEGNMTLKRQYRISKGSIEYMFDSSLKIDDEILQEILGKSVDDKMRTIVTTIQREQNRVIRDDSHKLLIVQGPAGSGKTSIALHRAAFLMYRYRETVNAESIIIFSPNEVFNDYISDVLPELGQENMMRTTFKEYALKTLGSIASIEDMNSQMEYFLSYRGCPGYEARVKGAKYKASADFAKVLRNYARYLELYGFTFDDVVYNNTMIITKEEIGELFFKDYSYLPVIKRLEKTCNRLLYLLEPYEKERIALLQEELANSGEFIDGNEIKARGIYMAKMEAKSLKDHIYNMTSLDLLDIYGRLFENRELFMQVSEGMAIPEGFYEICGQTIKMMRHKKLMYEDVAPVLFLKGLLGEIPNMSSIKHVIIDEAQDYTPIQFEVFKQLFGHSNLTLLGDINQSINPHMNVGKYGVVSEIFNSESTVTVELTKSYRSTMEITAFTKALLGCTDMDAEYINRRGDVPEVIKFDGQDDMYRSIINDVKGLKDKGYRSIALICKTAQDSLKVFEAVRHEVDVTLIKRDDEEYTRGVVVIPSYLSKGLEFDAVLVCGAGEQDFHHEDERKLLYTVCTRALHQLHIYYSGELSPFIKAVL